MHLCGSDLPLPVLYSSVCERAEQLCLAYFCPTVTIVNIPTGANCRLQRSSEWLLCPAGASETTAVLICSRCCPQDREPLDRWGIHQPGERRNTPWGRRGEEGDRGKEERGGEERTKERRRGGKYSREKTRGRRKEDRGKRRGKETRDERRQ